MNVTLSFQTPSIYFLFVGEVSFIAHQSCQLLIFLLSGTNSIWLTDIICPLTAMILNLFGSVAPLSVSQLRNLSQLTRSIRCSYSSWCLKSSKLETSETLYWKLRFYRINVYIIPSTSQESLISHMDAIQPVRNLAENIEKQCSGH